jgi:hypothetical protein
MKRTLRPAIPALCAFVLTTAFVYPSVFSVYEDTAETEYAATGAYFGGKLARFDLSPRGTHYTLDQGWSPYGQWARQQPMGTRLLYSLAMGLSGRQPAPVMMWWGDARYTGPDAWLSTSRPETLTLLRTVAVACAAVGFAFFSLRLGWWGVLMTALMLGIPHVREDFARAWAEGPLMLGFGLCALAYGTPRFAQACGVTATFKLTALGVWPLLLWRGANGRPPWAFWLALPMAVAVWTLLTPPSWFAGGPLDMVFMLGERNAEFHSQSEMWPLLFGLYVPTRYLWPIELAIALGVVLVLRRVVQRMADHRRPAIEPV